MNFKNIEAEPTTKTYDREILQAKTQNIYEAIAIMGKRAEQVNQEMKTELNQKLEEFAATTDTLEEVFENREQIEVSKFYERLPKPSSIAIKEWMENDVYFRKPEEDENA